MTDDFAEVRKVMECLALKGIHFYLDDFGTGYSNLSSVLALPFEVIKFDQSLIRMMVETCPPPASSPASILYRGSTHSPMS